MYLNIFFYLSNKWIGCASITQDTNEVGFQGTAGDQVYLTPCTSFFACSPFLALIRSVSFLGNPLKAITQRYDDLGCSPPPQTNTKCMAIILVMITQPRPRLFLAVLQPIPLEKPPLKSRPFFLLLPLASTTSPSFQ